MSTRKNNTAPASAPRRPWVSRAIKWMWILFVLFVLALGGLFVLVYNGVIGYMPPVEELKNPQDKFATVIYTSDGVEMGRYFRNTGNRVYADFDEISPEVVDALIATEDARFNDHSGIDLKAIARAIFKTVLLRQKNAGGGSTITQQLAKQLYTPPSNGLLARAMQKPIEWMIAIKLERFYSKEEILKMYLNQFDFLYNAVGIKSAAKVYFNKDAADLNTLEAATLIGMVKNPAYFNPVRQPERTRQRRNTVLQQMYKADMLTSEELENLSKQPLTLDFQRVDHKDGLAPYFREELRHLLTARKPVRSAYPSWDAQRYT
ncbi:MAG: penicillin-binding protein, partial [Muribaculaceae bacterium]|nr:penicillin-binding protein [Muribaculaceae bacterium]